VTTISLGRLENLPEIEQFRASLDDAGRRKINHPATVLRAWKRQQAKHEQGDATLYALLGAENPRGMRRLGAGGLAGVSWFE
jgi:hypothetical protein